MTLDDLEKISKIAFSGIGAFVLSYFTVTGKWNEFTLKEEQFCVNTESYYMQAALRSEGNPSLTLLERLQKRCGFASLDDAKALFHAERAGFQQIASDATAIAANGGTGLETGSPSKTVNEGWVALASIDANGTESNFLQAGSKRPAIDDASTTPEPGSVYQAKWPVNLRQNTNRTTGTQNPSLAILDAGTCVKLTSETVSERSIIWAPVTLAACNEDT